MDTRVQVDVTDCFKDYFVGYAKIIDGMIRDLTRELPQPYQEGFRTLTNDEFQCIKVSADRGRISQDHPLTTALVNAVEVYFSCDNLGTTHCIISCKTPTGKHIIYQQYAFLNPVDSFNKIKGQKLAFYRAVVESEGIILPD